MPIRGTFASMEVSSFGKECKSPLSSSQLLVTILSQYSSHSLIDRNPIARHVKAFQLLLEPGYLIVENKFTFSDSHQIYSFLENSRYSEPTFACQQPCLNIVEDFSIYTRVLLVEVFDFKVLYHLVAFKLVSH